LPPIEAASKPQTGEAFLRGRFGALRGEALPARGPGFGKKARLSLGEGGDGKGRIGEQDRGEFGGDRKSCGDEGPKTGPGERFQTAPP
jgi:hypothetical protein